MVQAKFVTLEMKGKLNETKASTESIYIKTQAHEPKNVLKNE